MDLSRRRLLGAGAGGVALLGGAKAVDNVVLGYDRFTGTNLHIQDVDEVVTEDLAPRPGPVARVDGYEIRVGSRSVAVYDGDERLDSVPYATTDGAGVDERDAAEAGAGIDETYGLADGSSTGPVESLASDLAAIEAGNLTVRPGSIEDFFDGLDAARPRRYAVQALRGRSVADVDPELVETFADADPRDTRALIDGIAEGFREYTYYDVPRYAAGAVEDNVVFGRWDVRGGFESPTDLEAIVGGENEGLYCTEMTRRAMEALHAVSATEQSPPVFTGYVRDLRHKHFYLLVASVVRDGSDLVVPVAFVDYMYATLYDDYRLTGLLGEEIDAYGRRYRADGIRWYD